jgi:hypothetical protein
MYQSISMFHFSNHFTYLDNIWYLGPHGKSGWKDLILVLSVYYNHYCQMKLKTNFTEFLKIWLTTV